MIYATQGPLAKKLLAAQRQVKEDEIERRRQINERVARKLHADRQAIRSAQKRKIEALEQTAVEPMLIEKATSSYQIVKRIQCDIAYEAGISLSDLLSFRRKKNLVSARHKAIFLAWKKTQRSLTWIGRQFNRDHTTILHAIQKMQRMEGQP
jgi:chromosomal replication initiator protein